MTDALFDVDPVVRGDARFSADGRYRYTLTRVWDPQTPLVAWIGLNPSTADATRNDPTVRRVIDFSRRWGYGGCVMLNLFAYRSTDPRALLTAVAPIGPDNPRTLREETAGRAVVAAWGASVPDAWRLHEAHVAGWLRATCAVYILGRTASGAPRHPLYCAASTEPVRWRRA